MYVHKHSHIYCIRARSDNNNNVDNDNFEINRSHLGNFRYSLTEHLALMTAEIYKILFLKHFKMEIGFFSNHRYSFFYN